MSQFNMYVNILLLLCLLNKSIVSYRIVSHGIVSYRMVSYRIVSYKYNWWLIKERL